MQLQIISHPELKPGQHAILAPSTYKAGREPTKVLKNYCSRYATDIGTALHALAQKRIDRHERLSPELAKDWIVNTLLDANIPREVINPELYWANLMNYVNDAIGFGMLTEIPVKYSDRSFGWIDAFTYDPSTRTVRIHDYKSGFTKINEEQTLNYVALWALEYEKYWKLDLRKTNYILHIYKSEIDENGNVIPTIIDLSPSPERVMAQVDAYKRDDLLIKDFMEGHYVLR